MATVATRFSGGIGTFDTRFGDLPRQLLQGSATKK